MESDRLTFNWLKPSPKPWLKAALGLSLLGSLCLALAPAKAGAEAPQAIPWPVGKTVRDCAACPLLIYLPGGSAQMGSPPDEPGRTESEGPLHEVTVRPLLIGKFEVTQAEWKAVMGAGRSRFIDCGDRCPVEQVSWRDAHTFLHRLSATQGLRYRLPTEAEWEYAARAGSAAAWASGNSPDTLVAHGWFSGVSARRTHEVGQKQANAFGLHDMTGNVWEWVEDIWHDSYVGAPADASAWVLGENIDRRVVRGGSWNYGPNSQRHAFRYWGGVASRDYDLGFRVVRDIAYSEGEWK